MSVIISQLHILSVKTSVFLNLKLCSIKNLLHIFVISNLFVMSWLIIQFKCLESREHLINQD